MDKEQAERLARKILGKIEETMSSDGVAVLLSEGRDSIKVRALFEDREYSALENTIVGILLATNKIQAVAHADSLDGHDW